MIELCVLCRLQDSKIARQDAMRYRAALEQQKQEKLQAIARTRELELANEVGD